MSADPYALPATHTAIIERRTYVPSWYKPHPDLTVRVTDENGGDLGFTVADVLPERRWAIQHSGKLLPMQEYERRYQDWIGRVVTGDGRVISMGAVNKYFDVTLESIPPPDEFVDAYPDPMRPGENRYIPMGMRGKDTTFNRTKVRPIYNVMGEKMVAGAEVPAPAPGFSSVPVDEKELKEAMVVTRCGKEVKSSRLNQHQAICKSCKHFSPGAPEPLDANGKPLKAEERKSA